MLSIFSNSNAAQMAVVCTILICAYDSRMLIGQEATPSIRVLNRVGSPVNIWVSPRGAGKWADKSPFFIPSSGSARLSLQAKGDYWVVVTDQLKYHKPVGFIDMNRVIALEPKAQFVIEGKSGEYETATQEYQYNVTVAEPQTQTRQEQVTEHVMQQEEYQYAVRVWKNGRWANETRTGTRTIRVPVTKTIEKQYTVLVPRTETKTGTRQVRQPLFRLKVELDGESISYDDFIRRHE